MISSTAMAVAFDRMTNSRTSTLGGQVDSTLAGDHAASSNATVAGSIEFIEYGEQVKMAIKRVRVTGCNR